MKGSDLLNGKEKKNQLLNTVITSPFVSTAE